MFLVNSCLGLFTAASFEAPLIPKLRGQLAEFLNNPSPVGLRILSSSTCVGLRYGHLSIHQSFSRLSASRTSLLYFRSLSPGSTNARVPLSTGHRRPLQRACVRSSMGFYPHFNLPMDRSPGFGSIATDFIRPIQTRSPCASGTECLKLASNNNSPDHSTKGTSSPFNGL